MWQDLTSVGFRTVFSQVSIGTAYPKGGTLKRLAAVHLTIVRSFYPSVRDSAGWMIR